ncbi:hypothetical protein N7519_010906 [Penicillium mononematosum]|uniref:uncharacterized protein n=1 Tax=Penicillium mononematosum TaxID=268346 RepID=UPI0025474834|nr:uncharacterized protein N7519_010906 [Penicillium mononematosum]KAJ6180445.1 hypothetical protein N7519_010906 [Penicillium mononematosum]
MDRTGEASESFGIPHTDQIPTHDCLKRDGALCNRCILEIDECIRLLDESQAFLDATMKLIEVFRHTLQADKAWTHRK